MSASQKQPSNAPASRAGQRSLAVRRASTTIQIILVCGVVIVGSQACLSMLQSSPDTVRSVEPTRDSYLPPMPAALPAAGTWIVGNSPLALGVEVIASDRLDERMAVPPRGMSQDAVAGGLCGDGYLASIRVACQVSHGPGGCTVYSLDQRRMKLRLFATGSGASERLVGGYLAYPREEDRWTLVVGTCKSVDRKSAGQPHLLPLNGQARSIAARVGGNGALQCEVVEVHGNLEDLCRHWRDRGWRVASERTQERQNDFSYTKGNTLVYLRIRRETVAPGRCILLMIAADALCEIENRDPQIERASS